MKFDDCLNLLTLVRSAPPQVLYDLVAASENYAAMPEPIGTPEGLSANVRSAAELIIYAARALPAEPGDVFLARLCATLDAPGGVEFLALAIEHVAEHGWKDFDMTFPTLATHDVVLACQQLAAVIHLYTRDDRLLPVIGEGVRHGS